MRRGNDGDGVGRWFVCGGLVWSIGVRIWQTGTIGVWVSLAE